MVKLSECTVVGILSMVAARTSLTALNESSNRRFHCTLTVPNDVSDPF